MRTIIIENRRVGGAGVSPPKRKGGIRLTHLKEKGGEVLSGGTIQT